MQSVIGPSVGFVSTCISAITLRGSSGEMCGPIADVSVSAALAAVGRRSAGSKLTASGDRLDCTDVSIPVEMQIGTDGPSPNRSRPNPDGFLIHPASFKMPSSSLAKWIDSSSWETCSLYVVPVYSLSAETREGIWISERGARNLFSSASACAARCNASARWDSASAACVLAETMSRSNESASLTAASALATAPSAKNVAASALVLALPESNTALWALFAACSDFSESETTTRSESVSFLCPYGYATTSQITATRKHHTPISANFRSLAVSLAQCARASKSASNTKKIIEANSKSLWMRLTASTEFQKGIQVVKYAMMASFLSESF